MHLLPTVIALILVTHISAVVDRTYFNYLGTLKLTKALKSTPPALT